MDIKYSQRNLEEQIRELNQNLMELHKEKDAYNHYFEIVKKNWSGDEYNKAEVELNAMGKSLDKVIHELTNQKVYLERKNLKFIRANGGRV